MHIDSLMVGNTFVDFWVVRKTENAKAELEVKGKGVTWSRDGATGDRHYTILKGRRAEEICYFRKDIKRKKWNRKMGKERLHTGSWESTKICEKDSVR